MMSDGQDIRIPVLLDTKTFRCFALFDTLVREKRWVKLLAFALIMIAFASIALFSGKPQSGLIAVVLLVIGCGLPIVYIGVFLSQVNRLAEKQKLGKGKSVYTVMLRRNDFYVINNQKKDEELTVAWKDADRAYRGRSVIYLYASPSRAFLLPSGQANVSDDIVWKTIVHGLGESRCRRIL